MQLGWGGRGGWGVADKAGELSRARAGGHGTMLRSLDSHGQLGTSERPETSI